MSATEINALLPTLVLSGGLVLMLLIIAFARRHTVARACAAVTLGVATLATMIMQDTQIVVLDMLTVDGYARFFIGLFCAIGLVTTILAYRYLLGRKGGMEEFYILVVTATLGACTMAMANHFATLLLGLEILSISLYTMIAYPEETHAPLEAATKYLILSGVASTTMLFGMALIFLGTGKLFFTSLGEAATGPYQALGQLMLLAGLAFKLSLVPFHMWTPDVYQGAPAPVSGYIATVSKGALFAVLVRLVVDGDLLSNPIVYLTLSGLAIVSMIIGNVLALMQQSLKRLLAYSSIAHMGYLMIGLIAIHTSTTTALEATLAYLLGYFLMTALAFGVITSQSAPEDLDDADDLASYQGLFWTQPASAAVLTIAMLSLAGMSLTIGFIAKFYLIAAGVESTLWYLLWALVVGSAISIYYYVKVIFTMTQQPDTGPVTAMPSLGTRATLYFLGLTVIALGIYPTAAIELIGQLLIGFAN
jgi:NADH-quinone oxidoreductase subunit N